jgi:hypothetical protein
VPIIDSATTHDVAEVAFAVLFNASDGSASYEALGPPHQFAEVPRRPAGSLCQSEPTVTRCCAISLSDNDKADLVQAGVVSSDE